MYRNIQWQISNIDNKINELTRKILNNPSNYEIETGIKFSHLKVYNLCQSLAHDCYLTKNSGENILRIVITIIGKLGMEINLIENYFEMLSVMKDGQLRHIYQIFFHKWNVSFKSPDEFLDSSNVREKLFFVR